MIAKNLTIQSSRSHTKMVLPFVSCLCPTYRRPKLLANALQCFLTQDYPEERRELIILDDAGQFTPASGSNWQLITFSRRYRSLPEKYNALAGLALGDVLVVWEDDDIYLPEHLSAHVDALKSGGFSKPSRVFSTHSNIVHEEEAGGRFHGSIAFTRSTFETLGGWPLTRRGDFDQQFISGLAHSAGGQVDPCSHFAPTYVFRWGSTGDYHGSARMSGPGDETWYDKCKSTIGMNSRIRLVPHFDAETLNVLKWWKESRCKNAKVGRQLQTAVPPEPEAQVEHENQTSHHNAGVTHPLPIAESNAVDDLTLEVLFDRAKTAVSDINEHCTRLRELTRECGHVTDFGMRPAVSTVALLAGRPKKMVSYSAWRYPEADLFELIVGQDAFEFKEGDSLTVNIDPTDLLFIDTKHTAQHLKCELARHADRVRRWIVLHDTVIFGERGEDGSPGLLHAIREFLKKNPDWSIQETHTHQYGLMVLVRNSG